MKNPYLTRTISSALALSVVAGLINNASADSPERDDDSGRPDISAVYVQALDSQKDNKHAILTVEVEADSFGADSAPAELTLYPGKNTVTLNLAEASPSQTEGTVAYSGKIEFDWAAAKALQETAANNQELASDKLKGNIWRLRALDRTEPVPPIHKIGVRR